MSRIAVLGTGGWGTAIAALAAVRGHETFLWGRDREYVAEMARTRENPRSLPGDRIPDAIHLTADASEAVRGAALVFVVIPAQFVRATLRPFAGLIAPNVPLVSGVKGLEVGTLLRPSEVFAEALGPHPFAVFSGPSHAEEIMRGMPCSLAVASDDADLARRIRDELSSPLLRLYVETDAIGIELAGALKNVMAIAAGICDGLSLGDNAKAALVTRALTEMRRFAVERGAKSETFFGLGGVGDLLTTCYSRHGRNRSVGERLARGESAQSILGSMIQVAEGVWTAKALHDAGLATRETMPITSEVHALVHEGKDPRKSVRDLMTRPPRDDGAM